MNNSIENVKKGMACELMSRMGTEAIEFLMDEPGMLNFIEPKLILEALESDPEIICLEFALFVNDYICIDVIWNKLIEKAKAVHIGSQLWKIKDRKMLKRCIGIYYEKVYPNDIERVYYKLGIEDRFIFDSEEFFDMFKEYWIKCGKPKLSEALKENLVSDAKSVEEKWALEAVMRMID